MIGWSGYGARLDLEHDLSEADEVDAIISAQSPSFVLNATWPLAFKWDLPLAELDLNGILVEDLEKPGPETPIHFAGSADDGDGSGVLRRGRQI